MKIDREEMLQFLRDNLQIDTNESHGYYGEHSVSVQLKLDGKVISETTINMPNTESRWQSSNC